MALFGKKKREEKKDEDVKPVETAEVKDEIKPSAQMPKGGDEHTYAVIRIPHLTEKASVMAGLNKYIFKVAPNSNKIEIKKAVEKMYKVKVKKVAVSLVPSKARRVGKHEGVKSGYKKAIVTLVEGDKIDIIS